MITEQAFEARVAGIPCGVRVTRYHPPVESDPGDPGDFDYVLLDRRGRRARWLEKKVTDADEQRFWETFRDMVAGPDLCRE